MKAAVIYENGSPDVLRYEDVPDPECPDGRVLIDVVHDRAVGDRIVTFNPAGSHASKRAVPATSTWPIPGGLDAAAAACVPVRSGRPRSACSPPAIWTPARPS